MSEKGIALCGYPGLDDIRATNGWPDDGRFAKGPVAIVECVQQIPCNPCENACPFGAIRVGSPITNCPTLDAGKCTGCGMCVAACSGLAIFVVDKSYSESEAKVSFPFEFAPLPEVGGRVRALDRAGEFVCEATVARIANPAKNDHTPVVTLAVPREFADTVRSMERTIPSGLVTMSAAGANAVIADAVVVCRCEEVTAGEIRQAIRSHDAKSLNAVKRIVRCGMGLCQGRTCSRMVTRILAEETGQEPWQLLPATDRPPVRPVTIGELAGGDDE